MMRPDNKRPVGETGSLHNDLWGQGQHGKGKPGRREAQGIGLDRNPGQRAPAWPKPDGADAMKLLAVLWGSSKRMRRRGRQ